MLFLTWVICFFYWSTHHIVHILIIFAVISLIIGIVKKKGIE